MKSAEKTKDVMFMIIVFFLVVFMSQGYCGEYRFVDDGGNIAPYVRGDRIGYVISPRIGGAGIPRVSVIEIRRTKPVTTSPSPSLVVPRMVSDKISNVDYLNQLKIIAEDISDVIARNRLIYDLLMKWKIDLEEIPSIKLFLEDINYKEPEDS